MLAVDSVLAVGLRDAAVAVAVVRNACDLISVQVCFAQGAMRVAIELLRVFVFESCAFFLFGVIFVVATAAGDS